MRLALLAPLALAVSLIAGPAAHAQFSLQSFETRYSQDFNTLAPLGSSSTLPVGWALLEQGSAADSSYMADGGLSVSGDTYSYGGANTDRALGTLRSDALSSTVGASFRNDTGAHVRWLTVEYVAEHWRAGQASSADWLDFQYSTDATSLDTGTWADVNQLDAFVFSPTAGALDGNHPAHRNPRAARLAVDIPAGAVFWIRWSDADQSGGEHGIAIDDFALLPGAPRPVTRLGTPYGESFDSLASSTSSAMLPHGWLLAVPGSSLGDVYVPDDGSTNNGTFSYGNSPDRALGGVRYTNIHDYVFGAGFRNETGATIDRVEIAYTGEQWRVGGSFDEDYLQVAYSTDAVDLSTGTWTPLPSLEFNSLIIGGAQALDGNDPANRQGRDASFNLSIPNGAVLWFRWTDYQLPVEDSKWGKQDGLAVDDFSLKLFGPDLDGDTVADPADNCPAVANPDQGNADGAGDGGDACDADDDNDGIPDESDPFPLDAARPGQAPGTGGGDGPTVDVVTPVFAAASLTHRVFAVDRGGKAEAPVAAVKKGTTFRYRLSEAARVVFKIERALPGRRVGGRCVKPRRSNRGRPRCVRHAVFGRFAQQAASGANSKRWSGKIGRRRVAVGRHRATLVATDAAGNRSAAKRLRFRVVRG